MTNHTSVYYFAAIVDGARKDVIGPYLADEPMGHKRALTMLRSTFGRDVPIMRITTDHRADFEHVIAVIEEELKKGWTAV